MIEMLEKVNNYIKLSKVSDLKENASGVYVIVNPLGKIYVGSSKNIKRRFYLYRGLYEKSQKKLFNSLKKYGVDSHSFIVVCNCDFESLYKNEREIGEFFQCLDREIGLNLMLPGFGEKKLKMSQEVKDKIGNAHRGKKISKEQIDKIILATKGKKQSKEHINKRKMFGKNNPRYGKDSPMKGKTHSLEVRKKISRNLKGKMCLGKNPRAKKVLDEETGKIYSCAKEASNDLKINYSTIKAWLQGRNNNFRFKYLTE